MTRFYVGARLAAQRTTAGAYSTPAGRSRVLRPPDGSQYRPCLESSVSPLSPAHGGTRGACCHFLGNAEELVVVDAAIDQANTLGLCAIHDFAEHHRGHGGLGPGDPAQHPGVPTAGMDTNLQESRVELRPAGSNPYITAKSEIHSGSHCSAVHSRQCGQGTVGDAQEALVDIAEAALGCFRKVSEVGSGTKGWRRAGHHNGSNTVIAFDGIHRSDDFGDHRRRQCISLRRIVQRERGDTIQDSEVDKGHARQLATYVGCCKICNGMAMDIPASSSPARPAATVVVVRDGDTGLEVLLLKRSEVGAFAGMWVFPGGRVDDADVGHDELSKARSAASREAFEEVGLAVDIDQLVTLSHWTPPAMAPKRFTTWFFVAPWSGQDVRIDNHEIVESRWLGAAEAISLGLPMAPPTFVTMTALSSTDSLDDLHALIRVRGVERFVTVPTPHEGNLVLLWEGDAGYETGDARAIGPRHRMLMVDDQIALYERTT